MKSGKKQTQQQTQKINEIQLQKQKYSHFIMASLLSTAENLVFRLYENHNEIFEEYKKIFAHISGISGHLIFESYDSYESGKNKNIKSLVNQFIFQMDNFYDDYIEFKETYGKFVYPNNMKKELIIIIINVWMNFLNNSNEAKSYLKYFENLLKFFNTGYIISYENEVRQQYLNNPRSGKADPKIIQRECVNAINEIDRRTRDIYNQNIDLFGKNNED